jgi:uncharacterized protein YuzE
LTSRIIVSATSDEAWDKVVDTHGIEKSTWIKATPDGKIQQKVAGTEFYDANNDLQIRGSENEIRRITYADSLTLPGSSSSFSTHRRICFFPSHPKRLTKLFGTI